MLAVAKVCDAQAGVQAMLAVVILALGLTSAALALRRTSAARVVVAQASAPGHRS